MTKKKIIGIAAWAVSFVAILLVATFYDLQINIALANADSIFGQFFRMFGELTGWIAIPVGGTILYQACPKNKGGRILKIFWFVVTLVGWFLTVNYVFEELTGASYDGYESPYRLMALYTAVFSVGLTFMSILGTNKIDKEIMKKLAVFAVALLFALALSQIITNIMKIMWTRQRFRNLDVGNGGTDATGFTPWYIPNFGKNKGVNYVADSSGMKESDAYKSFPSGHSAGAAISFAVVILPDLFEKLKKYKVWFYVVPAVYTVCVMISRIVNRAHYLSDTLFGATIGAVSCFIAIPLSYKICNFAKNKVFKKTFATVVNPETK